MIVATVVLSCNETMSGVCRLLANSNGAGMMNFTPAPKTNKISRLMYVLIRLVVLMPEARLTVLVQRRFSRMVKAVDTQVLLGNQVAGRCESNGQQE